ncbi:serine/threonine-protein kinase 17A-like [Platysternon megacephalum]|uniref:Serine/threonine-protein kinase 17A-like n=1 Tax=Platysternon megacephalum TaxID=55544 RepID=A0A4D9EIF1_9SAUR|nr:serine/threonine-protein kinase 17A-like [Platysternon megacephalum]
MLLLLLLVGVLCHQGDGAALHTFTMIQLAHLPNSSTIEFWGNATLNGVLTHSLQGFNASQLLPLEPPARWQEMERSLHTYLHSFHAFMQVITKERKVQYPLHLRCKLGCQLLSPDGASHSFYEVALNGDDFLSFRAANASWVLLGHKEDDELATFAHAQVSRYPQTTSELQSFLETTCVEFVRRHSKMDGARTEGQLRRSHTPLALGITLGAIALAALAVGVFLCTGGRSSGTGGGHAPASLHSAVCVGAQQLPPPGKGRGTLLSPHC